MFVLGWFVVLFCFDLIFLVIDLLTIFCI
jgi:hypothetical protein